MKLQKIQEINIISLKVLLKIFIDFCAIFSALPPIAI